MSRQPNTLTDLLDRIIRRQRRLELWSKLGACWACAAFLGLALMIGAHPHGLAVIGIVAALGAAGCRVVLLLTTRAALARADARMITWYSLLSSAPS